MEFKKCFHFFVLRLLYCPSPPLAKREVGSPGNVTSSGLTTVFSNHFIHFFTGIHLFTTLGKPYTFLLKTILFKLLKTMLFSLQRSRLLVLYYQTKSMHQISQVVTPKIRGLMSSFVMNTSAQKRGLGCWLLVVVAVFALTAFAS